MKFMALCIAEYGIEPPYTPATLPEGECAETVKEFYVIRVESLDRFDDHRCRYCLGVQKTLLFFQQRFQTSRLRLLCE